MNRQTQSFEHLVMDGESKDSTLRIVQKNSPDSRIFSEKDFGLYDALNKGIRRATGDIIGILHADDFYVHDRVLERVAKVFEDPEVETCYGDLVYVKGGGGNEQEAMGYRRGAKGDGRSAIGKGENQGLNQENLSPFADSPSPRFKILRYWKSGPFAPEKFKWGWMPPHPTFFVRRRVYERYGLFNLDLGSAADYELMLRFLLKYQVSSSYIPEVLVAMRQGGMSNATVGNRLKANRMDRKAWEVNGLRPYPWTLWLKPIRKIPQWWGRPKGESDSEKRR